MGDKSLSSRSSTDRRGQKKFQNNVTNALTERAEKATKCAIGLWGTSKSWTLGAVLLEGQVQEMVRNQSGQWGMR